MSTSPAKADQRIGNDRLELRLADAKPLYGEGEAVAEANRCLYCHDAPCIQACPTGIDIPGFIRKISTGNVRGSARRILSANLLGYSCARVCPVEVLCVGACVYNDWDRTPPIQIGKLQRYATERVVADGSAAALFEKAPATGKKVVCIGAGPASLAAAGYLAIEGVAVTVLEAHDLAGGLNATGVAPYKMHVRGALTEVDFIRDLGVTIREGVRVGEDVDVDSLISEYDAVFVGVGLGRDTSLGIPGEDGDGVVGATGWIRRMKLESGFSADGLERAVVIGGGNTAIDAARELAQLGLREVSLAYRRTEADMSGYAHELNSARHEGVRFLEKATPKSFVRKNGKLTAVEFADGRTVPCDIAVVAIGQAKRGEFAARFAGVELTAKGLVKVDEATGQTGNPKVFAGGDALGGELVVTAAQDGKRAARGICKSLGIKVRPDSPMLAGHD